jgi:signal peptidase II
LYERVEVLPVLDFTLLHNTGAAFSFLADASGWQRGFFITLGTVVSLALIVWMWRMPRGEKLLPLALSLIVGGAIGNVIDRIAHGYVIDFIHAHWGAAYFPAFNIADSAITIGAVLLILDAFREHHPAK